MLAQEIIRRKREKQPLSQQEITAFVAGLTSGDWSEGQVAALAMAIFFNGMSAQESADLTRAMTHSGKVLQWQSFHLPGPVLDKHSTGGVGDNVSLMLAPMVAACGGFVPMISGRGLGHTGGTLDKFDSIPGYKTQPDEAMFMDVVRNVGCAIIGQTAEIAPADKRFYAIRDVTATVESIPLITASILSKKLAAGLQGLVMDVKCGNGAFMSDLTGARRLSHSIVDVARAAGLPAAALITDMNEPLASSAGNAVEIQNAVDYLIGKQRDPRLHQITLALAGQMLCLGGLAANPAEAEARLQQVLDNGAAAERFAQMVAALGGPKDFIERPAHYLPKAKLIQPVVAEADGIVSAIDTRAVGLAVITLGGGRRKASDHVDLAVGFTRLAGLGATVKRGDALGMLHANTPETAAQAGAQLRQAYQLTGENVTSQTLFEKIV